MVVLVSCTQKPYTETEFQIEVTDYAHTISVTDACRYEELALIAVFVPLKVVLATTRIQTEEMAGKHTAVTAVTQPVTAFHSAGENLQAVFITIESHHGNISSPFTDQRSPIGTSNSTFGIKARSNKRLVFKAIKGRLGTFPVKAGDTFRVVPSLPDRVKSFALFAHEEEKIFR